MTNLEQFTTVRTVDYQTHQDKDNAPYNFGRISYRADTLADWKNTFSNDKKDYFNPEMIGHGDILSGIKGLPGTLSKDKDCIQTKQNDGLPEFAKRPADQRKDGIEYVKEKAKEVLGIGETLHDKLKELVIASLTPEQMKAYLKEEREWKRSFDYKIELNSQKYIDFRDTPQGPMHDLVDKLTHATEGKIAETAKRNISPTDRLQLERGLINGSDNEQVRAYEQRLLEIVIGFENKGALPKGFIPVVDATGSVARTPGEKNGTLLKQHCPAQPPWILRLSSW